MLFFLGSVIYCSCNILFLVSPSMLSWLATQISITGSSLDPHYHHDPKEIGSVYTTFGSNVGVGIVHHYNPTCVIVPTCRVWLIKGG